MNDRWIDRLLLLLRLALGAVFVYASIDKIANPAGFAVAIGHYQMLPYILIAVMAAVLPWLELACGIALIVNRWTPGASLLIILMNAVFIAAIASALARGLDISCGCFSTSGAGSRVGLTRLIEDIGFLAAAAFIYWRGSSAAYNR